MAEDWFYHNSGQTFGPMSAKQLRQHALAGKITRSDHVRIGTEGSWAPATTVQGLFEPPSTPIPMATAVPIPMATATLGNVPSVTAKNPTNNFDFNDTAPAMRLLNQPGSLTENQPKFATILRICLALLCLYGVISYKEGYFPFEGIGGASAYLKKIITNQLYIPVETVEISSPTSAVGKLASGETLVIIWRRTGRQIECICQKPRAKCEEEVRKFLSEMKYTVASVDIRPSVKGVGYAGQAITDNGITFDVSNYTDSIHQPSVISVKVSPQAYSQFTKLALEEALNTKVTEEDVYPKHMPSLNRAENSKELSATLKESLFKCLFKADGKWYAVEMYQGSNRVNSDGLTRFDGGTKASIVYKEIPRRDAP
ncbi:MAG: DUF4339 domain-containing protein [Gemmataceae bacterium]